MEYDKKMIYKCLECGHEKIGGTKLDGLRCEKCNGVVSPIRFADVGEKINNVKKIINAKKISNVKIITENSRCTKIYIDGKEINGVVAYSISGRVNEMSVLRLEILSDEIDIDEKVDILIKEKVGR